MFAFSFRLCKTYWTVMNQGLHQWNQGNQDDFIKTETCFASLFVLQSYRIQRCFLEIFPRGLPALTTATHGCVSLSLRVFWDGLTRLTLMLNGCFLKLSQSISSDCVPDVSSRNAFNTIFHNPLRRWWKKHGQSSVFILLHLLLFCFFGRITTSVCFLMTSVSLNISIEIQTSSLL